MVVIAGAVGGVGESGEGGVEWSGVEGGKDERYHIDLIDVPGHVDFTMKIERAFRVLDDACMMLYTVSGVRSQTITMDGPMKRYDVPRIFMFTRWTERAPIHPRRSIRSLMSLGCLRQLCRYPLKWTMDSRVR